MSENVNKPFGEIAVPFLTSAAAIDRSRCDLAPATSVSGGRE